VLTSRSEGIPLVLMEAMLQAKTVLAPAISGIPELVRDGKTGFLYQVGSIEDFVAHVQMISRSQSALLPLQKAAREHVLRNFNRETNLSTFADFFVDQIGGTRKPVAHEDLVLQ
jgi:glycosyltransferase involved in cell wall biosynthesis